MNLKPWRPPCANFKTKKNHKIPVRQKPNRSTRRQHPKESQRLAKLQRKGLISNGLSTKQSIGREKGQNSKITTDQTNGSEGFIDLFYPFSFCLCFFKVKKTRITLSGLKRWAYLWDCEQPKPFLFSGTTPDSIVSQIYAIISEYPPWFLPFWARHSPNYLYQVGTISQTHSRSRTPHLHSDRLSPESWEFQRCKIPTYLSYRSQHSKEPKLYNS